MKSNIILIIIFCFGFLLFLSSCEKEEIENSHIVYAGVIDEEMLYREFNPPLQVQLQTDSIKKIQFGSDSIDINLDGMFDLFINQRLYSEWNDNLNQYDLTHFNYPYCNLSEKNYKNIIEIASKKELIYSNNFKFYTDWHWVDTLYYKENINKNVEWQGSYMWLVKAIQGLPDRMSFGTWYNLKNTEKYIGIRMKVNTVYKLGWIKVKVCSRDNFEILSYAIEK